MMYIENFATQPAFGLKKENGALVADWPFLESDGPVSAYAVGDTGELLDIQLSLPCDADNRRQCKASTRSRRSRTRTNG